MNKSRSRDMLLKRRTALAVGWTSGHRLRIHPSPGRRWPNVVVLGFADPSQIRRPAEISVRFVRLLQSTAVAEKGRIDASLILDKQRM